MPDLRRTIDAIWRIESGKLIAGLARLVRDLGLAEDLAQDALVIALEKWPSTGLPAQPGAWLMTVAKNRALDRLRRDRRLEAKLTSYGQALGADLNVERPDYAASLEATIQDDLLSLIFTACHPILAPEARVALTLKVVGGLTTSEIARAYLVSETTLAQRIVRAKRSLSAARVGFAKPDVADLPQRLEAVLEVIYLIFNEGYAATAGPDWMRPELCEEALRLGRILAELLPAASEVHGLVALMEFQASRLRARITANGQPILLLDQNRARWDQLLIQRGAVALNRAERTAVDGLGPYALQAAIAACHARARQAADTDWPAIVGLYDALAQIRPSPVVALNRAVAVAMAYGPAAGLELVNELADHPALAHYHLLATVRADLWFKLGRWSEAAVEFGRAARLTDNQREQALLLDRVAACLAQVSG